MKTEGPVYLRSRAIARGLWITAVPAFVIITFLTWLVRPELLQGIISRPVAWLALILCAASAAALVVGLSAQRERLALVGSSFLLFGLLMTGAAALFPVLLFSTVSGIDPLTAKDCAAPDQSLWIATAWWIPAVVLAFIYLAIIQRHYSGKVSVPKDNQGFY